MASAGAYNFTYQYYAYDLTTGRYATRALLEATNPEVDTKTHTITDYFKGRGLGDLYTENTYHYENGRYVLVRQESQDFWDNENFEESSGYTHVVSVLRDGKMVEILREHLTHQDLWGDETP